MNDFKNITDYGISFLSGTFGFAELTNIWDFANNFIGFALAVVGLGIAIWKWKILHIEKLQKKQELQEFRLRNTQNTPRRKKRKKRNRR